MKHIPLTSIEFDSCTQLRAEINAQTVSDYADRMNEGDKFPPVDLFQVGDNYMIGDGWHRLLAYQKRGDVTAPAEIHQGGRADAIRFALGANAKHGMARSNADKRKAVEVALREWTNLSDREIGRMCGVGHQMVAKVRPQQLDESSSSPQPETRTGADGKVRRMPQRAEKPEPTPQPPSEPMKSSEPQEPPKRIVITKEGRLIRLGDKISNLMRNVSMNTRHEVCEETKAIIQEIEQL